MPRGSRMLALVAAILGIAVVSGAVQAENAPLAAESAFSRLYPVRVTNLNTRESQEVRLYDASGEIDDAAAQELNHLFCDARDPDHLEVTAIDRRTLKLAFKAAYHFTANELIVVSGFRKPGRKREGLHASGKAIDFKLPGVPAATLASYLRTLSRVGVGVYTHPRTQYVHLDVRDESYFWLDGSPPNRTWREKSLGGVSRTRDAAYKPESDWPEFPVPTRWVHAPARDLPLPPR